MKIRFTIALLAMFLLAGCGKEETTLPCEAENFGSMQVTNTRSESYDLYIDGAFQRKIDAGQTANILKVPARALSWEAKESSWIITQDVQSGTVDIEQCKHKEVNF